MSSRTGTWMIVLGGLVGFVGLCLMPAGLGDHGDRSLLGLGQRYSVQERWQEPREFISKL